MQLPTWTSVSTIVAAYNAERYIVQSIESTLGQTLNQLQVIVCNDASNDGTGESLKSIQDRRIRVITNAENIGAGPSRDRAIALAKTRWIAILDADDTWHPSRLERLVDAAERFNADVVFDDIMVCHEAGEQLVPWKRLHGNRAFGGDGTSARLVRIEDYVLSERLLIQPLIRTDFIRRHGIRHSSRRFAEDAEFYLRLALAGAKFCYVPEPLYHYRVSPGSLTAQAKDPALMRKCLEDCAQWEGWWPSAREALQAKIASLRVNEALYDLANSVRGGHFTKAAKLLAANPRLLAVLPRRLARQIHYQAHRSIHGGSGR